MPATSQTIAGENKTSFSFLSVFLLVNTWLLLWYVVQAECSHISEKCSIYFAMSGATHY